jgi:hypothetical protein
VSATLKESDDLLRRSEFLPGNSGHSYRGRY